MRRSEKKSCLKQLEALDKAINNNNKNLLQGRQELEELERKVAEKKEQIEAEVKQKEQNSNAFDLISKKLLDEKTIQRTLTYGLNKGILDETVITIPPKSSFDQLTPEQKRALIDIMMSQCTQSSFSSKINKGIDFFDNLIDTLTADIRCQEGLGDDN